MIVSPPGFKVSRPFIYGFGYDPINGDYKLVRVMQCSQLSRQEFYFNKVDVYSAKSNTWKNVSDFPLLFRSMVSERCFCH